MMKLPSGRRGNASMARIICSRVGRSGEVQVGAGGAAGSTAHGGHEPALRGRRRKLRKKPTSKKSGRKK
jgi:hypothetical protein